MSDTHAPMTASHETRAWSTSGYLILIAFLALLGLTVWRVVNFAGSQPDDAEVFGFVVSTGLAAISPAASMTTSLGLVILPLSANWPPASPAAP